MEDNVTSEDSPVKFMTAWVAPFVVFLVLTMLESQKWFGVRYEILYTVKTAAVTALLIWFRKEYPAFSTTGFGIAAIAGIVGIAIWIGLDAVQGMIPGLPALVNQIFGSRAGFDPWEGEGLTPLRTAFVAVRLFGLVIVVPLMEEVFWRGFLARYLVSEDFRSVPQGRFTSSSFAIVTIAFACVHPEFLAAIAWGAMINLVYWRTSNLWACVVMHAVTNALLGAYILTTGNWHLW